MSAPERPPPPIVGKVTHHSIELYWEDALEKASSNSQKGDGRIRICVQELDRHGGWGNVYTGYAKRHIQEGLEQLTRYTFRIRFMNDQGNSEWSPQIEVWTTKEPMTGEHVHRAILQSDSMKLEQILDSGDHVPIDATDKYGFTPLMQASQKGYIECLEILVNHNADINFQNDSGKTALMLAAYAGKLDIIKELRHYGARYDLQDKGGSTALHWAIDGKRLDLIEWMLDDGANLDSPDYNGWTPLIRNSAVGGDAAVAKLLLRNGAHINRRDKDGKTALIIAVVNGHHDLLEVLLEKGADLEVKNEFGKSAYEMAIAMERRRITKLLESHMDSKGIKYHH